MQNRSDITRALQEEKKIMEESKDISEISDEDKDILRNLLKEGLF